MKVFTFDSSIYNFDELIRNYLEVEDLTSLEAEAARQEDIKEGNSIYKNMEQTNHFKLLYEKLDSEEGQKFYNLFEEFITNEIRPLYDEPIIYQKKPSNRIHFTNSSGSARFHRDMDYGHFRNEINYTVPQTPMYDTNSIWIESEEGKADYRPMEAKIGEMVQFMGSYLEHGAKHNKTGDSRVSFDFRVMPLSDVPEAFHNKQNWEQAEIDHPLFKSFDDFGLCQ